MNKIFACIKEFLFDAPLLYRPYPHIKGWVFNGVRVIKGDFYKSIDGSIDDSNCWVDPSNPTKRYRIDEIFALRHGATVMAIAELDCQINKCECIKYRLLEEDI